MYPNVYSSNKYTIVRTQKQPRCPLTHEWIKMRYMYTMYSREKRNVFESVFVTWKKLEPIIQHEVSQREKNKFCILMHIYGIYKNGTDELI